MRKQKWFWQNVDRTSRRNNKSKGSIKSKHSHNIEIVCFFSLFISFPWYNVQKGASCIIKNVDVENTSEYNKTTDWQVSKNLIEQRGIYNEV